MVISLIGAQLRYTRLNMVKNDRKDDIQELNEKGFARISNRLLYYVRTNNMPNIKFFRHGSITISGSKGSIKYSSSDVFGDHHAYCFDTKRKKEFVDFLVGKLYKKHPDPELSTKKAFTHILHDNGLHWEGCCCCNRDRHKYIEKLKIKKGI